MPLKRKALVNALVATADFIEQQDDLVREFIEHLLPQIAVHDREKVKTMLALSLRKGQEIRHKIRVVAQRIESGEELDE